MHEMQQNWIDRESIIELITLYYTKPKYSLKAIGDEVGCSRNTVKRYLFKFENGIEIPQLKDYDLKELHRVVQYGSA